MSVTEYYLRGHFPFGDVESGTLAQAGKVLGVPVVNAAPGGPEVREDGLLVFTQKPDSDNERAEVKARIGFASNASVIFYDLSQSDEDILVRVTRDIVRVAASFAEFPEVHAVLLEDDSDDGLVMSIEDGVVVLNQEWDGWTVLPEALAGVPEPRQMRALRLG